MKKEPGKGLFWRNMPKIDANIVLRYLLNDHAERSPKAKEIIDQNIVEVPKNKTIDFTVCLTF